MKQIFLGVLLLSLASFAQNTAKDDGAKMLNAARAAMGGDALAGVKSLTATGASVHADSRGSSSNSYELALELPDKFIEKEELANVMGLSVTRTRGFNGATLINILDQPSMNNGSVFVRPAGSAAGFGPPTPEQKAADDAKQLAQARQTFARLTLGMFAASFPGSPLTFAGAGTVTATDGEADAVDVTGDGWTARLYFDAKSHRPIMLTWMDKEPLVMTSGPTGTSVGGGATMQTFDRSQSSGDREQMLKDLEARRQEAEARRRVVEYRMYYRDFKTIDGVTIPTAFATAIEGKPSSELQLGKIKINPKIDAKRFSAK